MQITEHHRVLFEPPAHPSKEVVFSKPERNKGSHHPLELGTNPMVIDVCACQCHCAACSDIAVLLKLDLPVEHITTQAAFILFLPSSFSFIPVEVCQLLNQRPIYFIFAISLGSRFCNPPTITCACNISP